MKRRFWGALGLFVTVCLVPHQSFGEKAQTIASSGRTPQSVTSLSKLLTPEATLRAFVRYLKAGNVRAASGLIVGAKPSVALDEMGRNFKTSSFEILLAKTKFSTRTNGDRAVLQLSGFKARPKEFQSTAVYSPEDLPLQRVNGRWQFVVGERADVLRLEEEPLGNSLKQIMGDIKFPEMALNQTQMGLCASQLKRWTTAYIRALQDYHILRWDNSPLRRGFNMLLEKPPTAVEGAVLRESTHYSFNAHLEGMKKQAIKHPERTILFYEGKAGKLEFRHLIYSVAGATAYTNVAFVDGHVESYSRQEVGTLRWKP